MARSQAGERGLRVAVAALAYRDYRRFAGSLLLTSLGVQLLQTAIFWQVYELTGDALLLGLTGLARALPHMVLSMVGGVFADRFNRVRLIQAGQIANGVLILALAGLTLTGAVSLWHLYAITFLNASFSAVTQPARTALIPSLIPRRNLVNAVALNATIGQTSQIIGPALGGIVVGMFDLGTTYLLNGAIYLAAMVAIVGIRTPSTPEATTDSPWRSFLEGLAFVRQRRVIVSLLMLDLAATVLGSYRALLPIFADSLGVGATGFGLLSAAPGVGSMIAATAMLSLGDVRHKGLYTVFGVLGYALSLVLLAASPWFGLSLVAGALLGATNVIQMIPRNSAILAISPDALRGRVEAFRSMLAGGGPPLGFTLSGALAAAFGAPLAVVLGAIACAVAVGGIVAQDAELRDPELGIVVDPPEDTDGVAGAG
ncbi:MAG: MFS transporter [Chloroflexi bacterium]|nr:MFS transporter [Chloroflexota bacterium]MDA1147111.1 MFS transporter [Chloroflexota bacterium]